MENWSAGVLERWSFGVVEIEIDEAEAEMAQANQDRVNRRCRGERGWTGGKRSVVSGDEDEEEDEEEEGGRTMDGMDFTDSLCCFA